MARDVPKLNLRERRLRRRRILVGLAALLLLLVFGLLAGATWLPFVRIHAVTVEGHKMVSSEAVERLVWEEIRGGYAFVFAKSNIFLYPKRAIRQELLKRFPTLREARVRADTFQSLSVTLVERQPVALWCGLSASSSGCSLMDEAGVVFAPAVMYSGDAYQKYYGPVTGEVLPQQFLDTAQFRALWALLDAIEKKQNLRAQTVEVVDGDVQVQFSNAFVLMMPLSLNNGELFERFELALSADPFKTHALSDFAYLDLRFGDKLYYKLR